MEVTDGKLSRGSQWIGAETKDLSVKTNIFIVAVQRKGIGAAFPSMYGRAKEAKNQDIW